MEQEELLQVPMALFTSSTDVLSPDEFIKYILNTPNLPPSTDDKEKNIAKYSWSFETKYYSTTVTLCVADFLTIQNTKFEESIEAFVYYFDPNEVDAFEQFKERLPHFLKIEPIVQMLVCHTSRSTDAVSRQDILEWCISNGFELVELEPEMEESDDEVEDDFQETTGFPRVVQALQSHTWSNLRLKKNPLTQSHFRHQILEEENVSKTDTVNNTSTDSTNISMHKEISKECIVDSDTDKTDRPNEQNVSSHTNAASASLGEEILLDDSIDWKNLVFGAENKGDSSSDSDDVEEFEQLFQKLALMKGQAEKLPHEERKKYAEQVAISFWKAIGGDDEEILGLDEITN